MGIPGFASRIRQYGVHEVIGRIPGDGTQGQAGDPSQGWPNNTQFLSLGPKSSKLLESHAKATPVLAIVDGPSLAHAIYQACKKEQNANQSTDHSYSYAKIGKAAVDWLNRLCSYGFTMLVATGCSNQILDNVLICGSEQEFTLMAPCLQRSVYTQKRSPECPPFC